MGDSDDKVVWGQVEKIGKGTRASYDPGKRTVTFCFIRNLQTSSEQLRKQREMLMSELKEWGFISRMKYNGEVVVDNVGNEDLVLVRKNHKLVIHLNKKQSVAEESDNSEKPA